MSANVFSTQHTHGKGFGLVNSLTVNHAFVAFKQKEGKKASPKALALMGTLEKERDQE